MGTTTSAVCDKAGDELLCCDAGECTKVSHLYCADLREAPDGEWFCAGCDEKKKGKRGRDADADPEESTETADKKSKLTVEEEKNLHAIGAAIHIHFQPFIKQLLS